MKKKCFFWFLLLLPLFVIGQGGDLLIQQYHKVGFDMEYYPKWNYDAFLQFHHSKPLDAMTKGRIHLNLGGRVHYRIEKTFGLTSGLSYQRIAYQYDLPKDQSLDQLYFLEIPLGISVYPTKRIRLGLGGQYHLYLNATGQPPSLSERQNYPKGTFVSSLGMYANAEYLVWKRFSVSLSYAFQKRSYNNFNREKQNFQRFGLGIHYTLRSLKRPKND